MKTLRITFFMLWLGIIALLAAHAQIANASSQFVSVANNQSVGILQVVPTTAPTVPAITVVVTNQVTTTTTTSSGGNNAGLIIAVVVLVLIILAGIIISSRRPREPL